MKFHSPNNLSTWLLMLFLGTGILMESEIGAAEPEPPRSDADETGDPTPPGLAIRFPELETVLDHPFADSAQRIQTGDVNADFADEKLQIHSGSGTLIWPARVGSIGRWSLTLEFPLLSETLRRSRTRLGLILTGDRTVAIDLIRTGPDPILSEIRLSKIEKTEEALVHVLEYPAAFPDGLWELEYNHGFVRIRVKGETAFQGYAEVRPESSWMVAALCQQVAGHMIIRDFTLEGSFATVDLSEKTVEIRTRARQLRDQAMEQWKQNQPEIALDTLSESATLFAQADGAGHPDVAAARSDLGHMLLAMGRPEEASSSWLGAFRMRRMALGRDHPLTLWAEFYVGSREIAAGQVSPGQERVAYVIPRLRQILSPEHPFLKSMDILLSSP